MATDHGVDIASVHPGSCFLFLGLGRFYFLFVPPWDLLKHSEKFQLPQLCVSELGSEATNGKGLQG